MPVFSESLEQSLRRALAVSGAGHHEYATLEHLLLALIDDPDVASVLRACNVDLEKLRLNLVAHIVSKPADFASDSLEYSKPTAEFHRVIQRAVTHVGSIEREEVTAVDALIAILAERDSQASRLLEEQGMTRYDATLYVSHGTGKLDRLSRGRGGAVAPAVSVQPLGFKVLLLNDDYTPMEFVVHVLERVFDKDHETAERTMLKIHNEGVGICGIYPYDAAHTKVTDVLDLAHKHQHPLQCVLERTDT
jgi:ATP-dependent Clp protease adapter protein ClpS